LEKVETSVIGFPSGLLKGVIPMLAERIRLDGAFAWSTCRNKRKFTELLELGQDSITAYPLFIGVFPTDGYCDIYSGPNNNIMLCTIMDRI
jgi:hypothetical protein